MGHAVHEGRFACIRHPDEADVGNQLELELDFKGFSIGSFGADVRRLVGGGFKVVISFPTLSTFADELFSLFFDKVEKNFPCFSIFNKRSWRDFEDDIFAPFTCTEVVASWLAVLGFDDAAVTMIF